MISQSKLHSIFNYNIDTGLFTYKVNKNRQARIGDVAGRTTSKGYTQITIDGKTYVAHKLAFLYEKGYYPEKQIDHKNRVKTDNRLSNLKEVTQFENMKNLNKRQDNTSGKAGVARKGKNWQSYINVNLKRIYLGVFKEYSDAVKARIDAEVKYGFVGDKAIAL